MLPDIDWELILKFRRRVLDAARRRDPAVKTCLLPETTDIMLVSPPEAMRFPWRFLFDYLTLEHRTPQEVNGRCFQTLIIGADPNSVNISTDQAEDHEQLF